MRWDDCLAPELVSALTPDQRSVLWLGRDYALDPRYEKEQALEGAGQVVWGRL